MTYEQLERGKELSKLIEKTELALNGLKSIKYRDRLDGRFYEDQIYNLFISEHDDGSGQKAYLSRYYGNERLIKVIINELETQLKEFKEQFAAL